MVAAWSKPIIYIGFDPRMVDAYAVARGSVTRRLITPVPVHGLVLDDLRAKGLYTRPTQIRDGRLWDAISEVPMSTEFAIARFLVKELAGPDSWALFMDSDFLAFANPEGLFALTDESKAVMVVKHRYEPGHREKMDGQVQSAYPRKLWSSLMLINTSHKANRALTVEYVNSAPGRDLHAFKWLKDEHIGEIPAEWNYLPGVSDPNITPKFVHFTEGLPSMTGYHDCEYADAWRDELYKWAT